MRDRNLVSGVLLLVLVLTGVGLVPNWAWALTAEEEAKLVPADGVAGDHFGAGIALDGATAIVGAAQNDEAGFTAGAAYVFTRVADLWTEQQKLLPTDGTSEENFGGSVSIDGNTALVGARRDDANGLNAGSAYVFTRSGGAWTLQAKLLAGDGDGDDQFGGSVAVHGNTALIGALFDEDNGAESGSAYVFTRSGGVWTETVKLLPADGDVSDRFGASVALDGDTALIGAERDDDNGAFSGSAYVFVRTAGVWEFQAKLLAADGAASDQFGSRVALSGDTALVGAYTDDDDNTASGSAYVFVRTGSSWSQQAKLLPSDGSPIDNFGLGVDIDGDTALVGSRLNDGSAFNSGSAYVFTRKGKVWTERVKLIPADGPENAEFGTFVALDGDTAIGGSVFDDDNGQSSGAAYVFRLAEDGDDVPGSSGVGTALLLLTILGTGWYFVRR